MADKPLNIRQDLHVELKLTDTLSIHVISDCNWCFADKDGVFGHKPGEFLPAGLYKATKPPTVYGPYTPKGEGTVNFNATAPGTHCDPNASQTRTPHTITVSTRR